MNLLRWADGGHSQRLWWGAWSLLLALGWLLPNHYPPWPNFHTDFWIAAVMAAAAAFAFYKARQVQWSLLQCVAVGLVVLPLLQYAAGLLFFAGQAWIGAAYIAGFALALLAGSQWERQAPGQAISALFLAIGAAAIVSVGVQLAQWLILDHGNTIWLLPSPSSRPYANFAQPNQLATFLMWGLAACAWGVYRGAIRLPVALLMAAWLLFGVALAESRTALLSIVTVALAAWVWRRRWRSRRTPWLVTGLALYAALCVAAIPAINDALHLGLMRHDLVEKTRNEARGLAYEIFIDAVLQRPFAGYGWSQTARAQLEVAQSHLGLHGHFFHAHNLVLDLLLWCGIPLGGFLVAVLARWVVRRLRAIENGEDGILLMFVGVVAWHGMTELPLHYASFLLPTGFVMGVLEARKARVRKTTGRVPLLAGFCAAALVLAVTAKDYLAVEANFFALRFERAGLSTQPPLGPPDVILLTQLREYIVLMRTEPNGPLTEADLKTVRDLAYSFPSEVTLFNLIRALALNGRNDEAREWMKIYAKVTTQERYDLMQRVWVYEGRKNPPMLALTWPNWTP